MIILIVENDAINALSVMDELLLAGHEVLGPVTCAPDAYQLASTRHPALALVDIDLGREGEGLEIAQKLQQSGVTSLFVTAQAERARQHHDRAIGLLPKPFDPEDISEAVDVVAEVLQGGQPPPDYYPLALEIFPT